MKPSKAKSRATIPKRSFPWWRQASKRTSDRRGDLYLHTSHRTQPPGVQHLLYIDRNQIWLSSFGSGLGSQTLRSWLDLTYIDRPRSKFKPDRTYIDRARSGGTRSSQSGFFLSLKPRFWDRQTSDRGLIYLSLTYIDQKPDLI